MDMKTITPLHLLVQGDSGNLRTWLYDLFIKGFSTHYFLATRLFLPAASTRSASIPASFSNRAYPHCAGPTPVIYPSTAVPKPGATRAPHVLHFYLFPLVRHTWRAASRQTTGCWHGHLALLTSPVSSFDSASFIFSAHHRASSLTAHLGWISHSNFLSRGHLTLLSFLGWGRIIRLAMGSSQMLDLASGLLCGP